MLILLFLIPCGFFSSTIAANKDYDRVNWFIAGLFFGPLGLIAIVGMPDKKLRRYIRLLAKSQGLDMEEIIDYPKLPPSKFLITSKDNFK